jgi:hypothetical protein
MLGRLLHDELPYAIRECYRPEWLISSRSTRLELDFYIDELKIAFEVQGVQHFSFVPFFHKTESDFVKRVGDDIEKKNLCEGRGVKLIEIHTETDAIVAVKNIKEQVENIHYGGHYRGNEESWFRKFKNYNKKKGLAKPSTASKNKEDEIVKFKDFVKRRIKEGKSEKFMKFNFRFIPAEEREDLLQRILSELNRKL